MQYYALVRRGGSDDKGDCVAKVTTGKGMMNIDAVMEVSGDVDLVMVVACASYLMGSGSSTAGALAGAGVV